MIQIPFVLFRNSATSNICTKFFPLLCNQQLFSTTIPKCLKEIRETQNGKQLIIEGVIITSPREKYYLKTEHDCDACPLCRLNLDIKHTDVLILCQFLRSDGCMLPRRVTGLCKIQQRRVATMVAMAQKAGIHPGGPNYLGELKEQNNRIVTSAYYQH